MGNGGKTEGALDRQAAALQLAEELLTDIELSRCQAQQIVLKASRLARLMRDEYAQVWLGYELDGYPLDGTDDELLARTGRWADRDKEEAYPVPLAELSAVAGAEESKLQSMKGTSFGGDYARLAAEEHRSASDLAAHNLGVIRAIEAKVVAFIHQWATRAYHELLFSDLQADLFTAAQAEIDGRLAPLAGSALSKIESINERLREGDAESVSQAMSTCRRLIDAAADALFPARDEPYLLGEQSLDVRQNRVLNRLSAYVADRTSSAGRRERLRHTLTDLYARSSAGTHAEVDVTEARYLFLNTYIALGELLALSPVEDTSTEPTDT